MSSRTSWPFFVGFMAVMAGIIMVMFGFGMTQDAKREQRYYEARYDLIDVCMELSENSEEWRGCMNRVSGLDVRDD